MKQSIQLRLSQQLTMTPQLQQAIRLLQLTRIELREYIQEAVDANPLLEQRHDGAVFDVEAGPLAFSTDSYVVHPLEFPGGNIGDLAVNGTVNDLAVSGAQPKYLSLNAFIEAGLWDEARVFKGKVKFGDGLEAPKLTFTPWKDISVGEDRLLVYKKERPVESSKHR